MAWGCMAANETGSLFIDDVTADRSSSMNSEVQRAKLIAAKLIGQCFTVQVDKDPKHTMKAKQEVLRVEKCNIAPMAKSFI